MSHSSGIPVSEELMQSFGAVRKESSARYVQAVIKEEKIVEVTREQGSDDIKQDFHELQKFFQPKIPTFVLFRLDTKNQMGNEWVLVCYVPDNCPVKDRMLYASSRDNLKRQLGSMYFVEDFYGSSPDELTYDNLKHHLTKKYSEGPLTQTEILSKMERFAVVEQGASKEYVHSVAFPLSAEGKESLQKLAAGELNFVQLRVDISKETLELEKAKGGMTIGGLLGEISVTEPRFTFFSYAHSYNNADVVTQLFVYSCPNESPVKMKMLYSTVKAVAVGCAEGAGFKLDKKLEITELSELSETYVNEEIHGRVVEEKKAFSKPAKPGKGPARLIRK